MNRIRLTRTTAFWSVAGTSTVALLASAAPSPLYPVYQRVFGFSALTLTAIFAVYVLALVGTLLTVGSISDQVGRRPVLAVSIVLLIASMALFLTADGVTSLLAARFLQGIATGALTGTISAYMVDLAPTPRLGGLVSTASPPLGLALGGVVSGALVQYAPHPRQLIFVLLIITLAALLALVCVLEESAPSQGFSSRRHFWQTVAPRAAVPASVRTVFWVGLPILAATWSLAGLYLSLGSSVVARLLGVTNHATAGAVIGAFFGAAAICATISSLCTRSSDTAAGLRRLIGFSALGVGVCLSLLGTETSSTALYLAGSVVAGAGFGVSMHLVMSGLAETADPAERGRVFAAVYAVSYIAFSVPAVVAGYLTIHVGLRETTLGYGIFVIALVALAAVLTIRQRIRLHRVDPLAAADDAFYAGLAAGPITPRV
ncbi:MFS transporter [Williamsia sp. CHRR-6]|uniref:MFS transporter n=1 Tax=Williamsia sp. CHRR-6 TaxID=2835871 RepID=UPI001BD954B1|nr:MFS transporter [Williamsia sp. CHRR-6]MBT0567009.1 MFS transporter [Williamsia sp. CHRR-6]